MPMYEKGSVRAEPRSKQQERMKKIMKKFLSSLLALTMILSLVVVPANAATREATTFNPWSVDMSAEKGNLEKEYSISDAVEGSTFVWRTGNSDVADISGDRDKASAKIVARRAGSTTIYCVVTPPDTAEVKTPVEYSGTIEVTDRNRDFKNAITTIKVLKREYSTTKHFEVVTFGTETLDSSAFSSNLGSGDRGYSNITYTYTAPDKVSSDASLKITGKKGSDLVEATFKFGVSHYEKGSVTVLANDAARNDESNPLVVNAGQVVKLKATAYNGNADASYSWTATAQSGSVTAPTTSTDGATRATWVAPNSTNSNGDKYTITCTVTDGDVKTYGYAYISVVPDPYHADYSNSKREFTIVPSSGKDSCDIEKENKPILKANSSGISDITSGYTVAYKITSGSDLVTVNQATGKVTAKSNVKSGTATITATITFNGKNYEPLTYKVNITALDSELASIVNGESDSYSLPNIKDKLVDAIKKQDSSFRYNDINTITVVGTPSRVTLKNGRTTLTNGSSVNDDITIYADEAYIGDASFQLKVNNNYVVTMYLTVDSKGEIKDTVTGTTSNKSVTFTNSDYDYLYIYEGSASFKSDMYNGDWSRTSYDSRNWKPVAENKDYTVSSSAFDRNGKATLYVVAVDGGIASTGTITVSQKSYDINYNVVAGKSVSFSQKDFESFLEDYAEDNGNYNSRKDELSFDHAVLTSSVPSAKSEGTLYYGSTEITSSNKSKTDMTDMDKVSFDSVSKPSKDTVTLTFRVYGEIEKPNSRKPDKVNYDVNVVISVVKEDITYTVGIDDTVQLTARDFVNFLQDARTSYRKAELDYVKFDVSGKNVSSYAYGGLYRSYSSYSTGKLADSTDKFYYEPSRTQYDLADVAYHTTRWAEAGKTVYIPFTVYGTKNEEASGTMAITIAQTMNFIDVKASDFFYEPVKWAVNNKITNGTSSTTFSPYKNCNRAEIVTFLWRAAGTPEPTVTRNPFTDVNSVRDASYYKAILWASQKGITAGTTATTFSPYQECTRSQIVTFLYRYAGKPSGNYTNPFKDVSSVNEASYYNAILWAVGKGITQGTSTTTFSPYASCTRGEAVTFLYRYVNGVK